MGVNVGVCSHGRGRGCGCQCGLCVVSVWFVCLVCVSFGCTARVCVCEIFTFKIKTFNLFVTKQINIHVFQF